MHHHLGGYLGRIARALCALLVVAVVCGTWSPATATPLKCRRTVAKASAVFTQAGLKAVQKCEDTILRGSFAGPCPDQKAVAKILKLRGKLAVVIAHACGGGDKSCGAGDEPLAQIGWTNGVCPDLDDTGCVNTVTSCAGIVDCLRCVDETAVGGTIDLAFDAFVRSTLDPSIRKCQRAIGKETAQFVGSQLRALQLCEDRALRGKIAGPCPDLAAAVRLGKIQAKLQQKICKVCGGPSRGCGGADDLTPSQIGFASTCPDVTIPGGASCGGPVTTLAEAITCLDCVGRHRAVCLDRAAAPGVATYPPECNDVGSDSATPTPTPTPTATATPGSATATETATPGGAGSATPTPTDDVPTPTPTATATSVTVKIDLSTVLVATLVGLDVTYPTAKGGFAGSGNAVSCDTDALGLFSPNDDDNGLLGLDVSLGLGLSFPLTITCTFDLLPGETLIAADLQITVDDFLNLLLPLDPSQLGIVTQILP